MTFRHFNHLDIPEHWEQYWSKYPNGYTIMEALIDWVSQVDKMVDSSNETVNIVINYGERLDEFIGKYDTSLQSTLKKTLTEWQQSGFLKVIIDEALQTEMDDLERETTTRLYKLTTEIESVDQSVRRKAESTDVRKLSELITVNDFDSETLGIIKNGTGGVPIEINAIPKDRSVTPLQTNFFVTTTNKFNKEDITTDATLTTTGETMFGDNFITSGFIRVTETETSIFKNARVVMFYRADKTLIPNTRIEMPSGVFEGSKVINPVGTFWLRFSWFLPNEPLESQQVNVGEKLLPYEHTWNIQHEMLEQKPITRDDLTFYTPVATPTKNRHSLNRLKKGFFINQANGELLSNEIHNTYEIDVTPYEKITLNKHQRSAFYGLTGNYIAGSGLYEGDANTPLTREVPYNAYRFKYSVPVGYGFDTLQVESGDSSTSFVSSGFTMPDLVIPETVLSYFKDVNLPQKIYATVGEELKIYNRNIIKDDVSEFNIDWDSSQGKQTSDGYSVTPTTSGSFSLQLNLYRKSVLIQTKTTTVIVSNKRTTPKIVLEIGDSTTVASRNAFAVKRLKDKLGENIQLIGKMGDSPILYEGRGGWKAETYRTDLMYYDEPNYFYNPTKNDFDFAYYMNQNGFTNVDVVILNLGINDVFGQKDDNGAESSTDYSITHTDFIINSILAYKPSIKIALNIAIPPSSKQDIFGSTPDVALFQTQWRAEYNNFIYVSKLISHYQGKVDLIPIHAVLDTENNLADHVHTIEAGYYQIGDQKVNYLNSL